LGTGYNQYIDQLRPTGSYSDQETVSDGGTASTNSIPAQTETEQNTLSGTPQFSNLNNTLS
jgi:hypothetical protein